MTNPTEPVPQAWRADNVGEPEAWRHTLSRSALTAFLRHPDSDRAAIDLRPNADLTAALAIDIAAIHSDLEHGRGFVIVSAGESARYSHQQQATFYWLLGSLLGRPVEQNVQGALLYEVKDTGQDVRYGARFSVTNSESSFHTDSSFMDTVTDYVGLLCLNDAKVGGLSQVVDGYAVRDTLLASDPAAWHELIRPFHIDRRGGIRPGEAPTVQYPVFSNHPHGLLMRYLRFWIEAGHEKAGVPLSVAQIAALDTLDRVASDPTMRAEFAMRPGDMLFLNNRRLLHNRTAFEDHPEPDRRRHFLRLWLAAIA